MNSRAATKIWKGRTIKKIEMRPFLDGRGGWAYDPIIRFEDGTALAFAVQETEWDHGVDLVFIPGQLEERNDKDS